MNRNTPATNTDIGTPTRDQCWKCGQEPRVPAVDEFDTESEHAQAVAAWFTGGLCPVCYDLVLERGLGSLADALDAMLEDPSDP